MSKRRIVALALALILSGFGVAEAHTAPTLTPAQEAVRARVDFWAVEYAQSPAYLESVVQCESGFDAGAVSPTGDYGAAQWHFSGPGLWFDFAPEGRAGLMPWDVSVDRQLQLMAEAFAAGFGSAWSCA